MDKYFEFNLGFGNAPGEAVQVIVSHKVRDDEAVRSDTLNLPNALRPDMFHAHDLAITQVTYDVVKKALEVLFLYLVEQEENGEIVHVQFENLQDDDGDALALFKHFIVGVSRNKWRNIQTPDGRLSAEVRDFIKHYLDKLFIVNGVSFVVNKPGRASCDIITLKDVARYPIVLADMTTGNFFGSGWFDLNKLELHFPIFDN